MADTGPAARGAQKFRCADLRFPVPLRQDQLVERQIGNRLESRSSSF